MCVQVFGLASDVCLKEHHAVMVMAHGGLLVSKLVAKQHYWDFKQTREIYSNLTVSFNQLKRINKGKAGHSFLYVIQSKNNIYFIFVER